MLYREHPPSSCLKPYLKCYWTLQVDALVVPRSSQRLLAESFEFTFNLAAPIDIINCEGQAKRIHAAGITGPMNRPMRLETTGSVSLFGICFRPGGGYPFFKYAAHELVNQYPDVEDLWGSRGRRFVEYIQNDCHTTEERMEAADAYLADHLATNLRDEDLIQKAIRRIETCKGGITVDQLAHHLGISRRHLTRKFKERIGMTPKQLCRNTRFKQVYKLIEALPHHNWADVALSCGYYDQSHLINEFKYFTGSSPAAYLDSSPDGPDFFTANF